MGGYILAHLINSTGTGTRPGWWRSRNLVLALVLVLVLVEANRQPWDCRWKIPYVL